MRLKYSLIFFIISTTLAHGQSRLSLKSLDLERLMAAVTTETHYFRDTIEAPRFQKDKILEKAAANHAAYCLKTASSNHYQSSKKLKTPEDRALHFGSEHGETAEIVVKINLSRMGVNSYQDIADLLLRLALKSPTNRRNFRNEHYQYVGQSARLKSGELYYVWVLASPVVFTKEFTTPDDLYGLSSQTNKNKSIADEFNTLIKQMPPEVSFDVFVRNDSIYFVMSDVAWFGRLFSNKNDGFAVDFVLKDQFACGISNVIDQNPNYTGYLMPPVFAKSFRKLARVTKEGIVMVPAGLIPHHWKDKEYEINVVLFSKGVISRYNSFFRIPFGDWQTLNLRFDTQLQSSAPKQIDVLHKRMNFMVPFEKGKSTFNASDIKPLADSMKLTDYQIKRVEIRAFASVEGNKKTNLALQQNRAQSIIEALETVNQQNFKTDIYLAENWVEFFHDIIESKWSFLANKSQDDIREYLNTHQLEGLDKILEPHRKATIQIDLERRQERHYISTDYLRQITSLPADQLLTDHHVIDEILNMNEDTVARLDLLDFLVSQTRGNPSWTAEATGRIAIEIYQLDPTRFNECKKLLNQLTIKDPNSSMLVYNSLVFELMDWEMKGGSAPDLLQSEIKTSQVIPTDQKARLLLNFAILETDHLFQNKKYAVKDATIQHAYKIAKETALSEEEIFVVAKYLASYQKYDQAIRLLKPYVDELDTYEDLLFLYINLTIIKDNVVNRPDYRTMLTNASLSNHDRFCQLFRSSFDDGITFQLLRNKFLKRTYCEQCH